MASHSPLSESDRRAIAEAQRALKSQAFTDLGPALARFAEQQRQVVEALTPALQRVARQYADLLAQWQPGVSYLAEQARSSLASLQPAFAELAQHLERLVPANLRARMDKLDELWTMAVETGIAVCWVPQVHVLDDMLNASTLENRIGVLVSQRSEILETCAQVLATVRSPAADACRSALAAAADGHHDAAQSLAGNVIDSFVLANVDGHYNHRRARAKQWAADGYSDEDALRDLFDVIALAPTVVALASWWPGDDPPRTFNRHATAHAAGEPAVYNEGSSIVALVAAVSITRHFYEHRPGLVPLEQRVMPQATG